MGLNLPIEDRKIWNKVRPSIITLVTNDKVTGLAACIDTSGLFIAGRSAVKERFVKAITANGELVNLHWINSDPLSGLVLLQSSKSNKIVVPALQITSSEPDDTTPVLAALVEGPARAEIALSDLVARISASAPALSMDELCIEAPIQPLAGTLYFDQQGRLAGILGAWLGAPVTSSTNSAMATQNGLKSDSPSGATKNVNSESESNNNGLKTSYALPAKKTVTERIRISHGYGPAGLIIAYGPSTYLFRQVVNGFLSPNHEPQHPYFGASCVDASARNKGVFGAVIVAVDKGSPAETAGLQVGDVIVAIDGKTVQNQVEMVRTVLHCQVGDKLQIQFMRGGKLEELPLSIGQLSKKILSAIPTH